VKKAKRGRPRRKGRPDYAYIASRIPVDLDAWVTLEAKRRDDTRSGVVKQAIAFHRLHIERETGKT